MSVLRSPFRKSRLEVINRAEDLRDRVLELAEDDFGIQGEELHAKSRIRYGRRDSADDIRKRASIIELSRNRIDNASAKAVGYLRGANMVWPSTEHDRRVRAELQDKALGALGAVLSELEMLESIFDIDLERARALHEEAIEVAGLVNRWKRSDRR